MQLEDIPFVRRADSGRTNRQILDLFRDEIYGGSPALEVNQRWNVVEEAQLDDGSWRRQIVVHFTTARESMSLTLLVYLPSVGASGHVASKGVGVPAFVGMNFRGNHSCDTDESILDLTHVADSSVGQKLDYGGLRESFEVPVPRGAQASRWDFRGVTSRGYAVVTWSYLQVGPDSPAIFRRGPQRLASDEQNEDRLPSDWGSISMWAWSMSRVLDAIKAGVVPEIDSNAVIAHGHSRLGKAAMWAAVSDHRFAGVVSNNSGAMGAALSRPVGETPEVLARIRPHWFAPRFSELVMSGLPLSVDQHELIALMAPRPVYVSSASEDKNADPEGEFLSWRLASRSWNKHGPALNFEFPRPGTVLKPSHIPLGFHLREGQHDVTAFDWAAWCDWADRWISPRAQKGA